MKRLSVSYIVFLFILSSCSWFQNREFDDKIVARVGENYLYESELIDNLSPGLVGNDSIVIARNFINNWARKQLVLEKAHLNLSEEQVDVEKLVEAYRNSLIRQQYEQVLIQQYLDTLIYDNEISSYYETHKFDLKLNQDLLQALYVKINKLAPEIDELKRLCVSDTEEYKTELEDYCFRYAKRYYNSDNWLTFEEIYSELPIDSLSEFERYENNFLELEDSLYFYFLRIKDVRLKEEKPPLQFVRSRIQKVILLNRKQELIRELENSLYEDALLNGYFEMY